jgi:UDP-3-O-[3-hydroxymyristoyl] N-acetylglucosamine deacetylase
VYLGGKWSGGIPVPSRITPMTAQQKTLKAAATCRGVGLHSGQQVSMTLHPAVPSAGLAFRRADLGGATIPVRWDHVVDTRMATTLGNPEGVRVGTVEHLMAALAGCEIDNALIELDGPEVPVMDGSAAPFVELIEDAGIVRQAAARRAIEVLKPIEVRDAHRSLSIEPNPVLEVSFEIDFDSPAIARQTYGARIVNGTFKADIAAARTFGFAEDVEALRRAGLALGGSLDNAIVIRDGRVLNEGGLRFDDEFVRHKILDCVGDLYLAGGPILGRVHGVRSGHTLHNLLLRAVFADASAWRMVDALATEHAHGAGQELKLAVNA